MQYLASFALGLQSKVLIPIIRVTKKGAFYIVRSPFKALMFCLKFYFTLMLLLFCIITFFASFGAKATTVYDRASTSAVNAGETLSCDFGGKSPASAVAEKNEGRSSGDGRSWGQSPYRLKSTDAVVFNNGSNCQQRYYYEWDFWQLNGDGSRFGQYTSQGSGAISGQEISAPTCLNLPNSPNHSILGKTGNQNKCYTSYDLTDVSSCDSQNNDVLASSGSPANVCRELSDGSKCAMEKYSVGGSYAYTQMVEPSTCFDGPLSINAYEDGSLTPPTDDDNCFELGNGVSACPADPNESCPNGQCATGCGTFDIGGGSQFVCLTGGYEPIEPIDPIEPVSPVDISSPEFDTTRGTNTLLAQQGASISTLNLIGQSQREEQIKTNRSLSGIDGEMKKQTGLLEGIKESLDQDENTSVPANFGDGQLYEPNDYDQKNYGTVLIAAVDEMKASPIFEAVDNFFTISLSGSCPTYSTSVPYLNTTITIDQFCSTTMQSIWPVVKSIILLIFSFLAFRVAVL